jgi:hypothetical protein
VKDNNINIDSLSTNSFHVHVTTINQGILIRGLIRGVD